MDNSFKKMKERILSNPAVKREYERFMARRCKCCKVCEFEYNDDEVVKCTNEAKSTVTVHDSIFS